MSSWARSTRMLIVTCNWRICCQWFYFFIVMLTTSGLSPWRNNGSTWRKSPINTMTLSPNTWPAVVRSHNVPSTQSRWNLLVIVVSSLTMRHGTITLPDEIACWPGWRILLTNLQLGFSGSSEQLGHRAQSQTQRRRTPQQWRTDCAGNSDRAARWVDVLFLFRLVHRWKKIYFLCCWPPQLFRWNTFTVPCSYTQSAPRAQWRQLHAAISSLLSFGSTGGIGMRGKSPSCCLCSWCIRLQIFYQIPRVQNTDAGRQTVAPQTLCIRAPVDRAAQTLEQLHTAWEVDDHTEWLPASVGFQWSAWSSSRRSCAAALLVG